MYEESINKRLNNKINVERWKRINNLKRKQDKIDKINIIYLLLCSGIFGYFVGLTIKNFLGF